MKYDILRKADQAVGGFNNGEIIENKPIGFPGETNGFKPYSNLFYWANASSRNESLIAEHPHQGFEIMSFVLKGYIEHYDSKNKDWRRLNPGDAQIIRAGNGITHAEKMGTDTQFFQIWFDPGLQKTLGMPASYNDYKNESFSVKTNENLKMRTYVGKDSPIIMESENVTVKLLDIDPGDISFKVDEGNILSAYLIEGKIHVDGHDLVNDDFFRFAGTNINIRSYEHSRLFVIESPAVPSYKTYGQLYGRG